MQMNERYTVEPCPAGGGFHVADNAARSIASGPWPSQGRAAYECDVLRRPVYSHNRRPRATWEALGTAFQRNWERHPTARDWPA